jgi:hypothetical protein
MFNLIENILFDLTEKDYLKTQCLIASIEEQFDKVDDFIIKSISHILNVHHILNARLRSNFPDSDLWDVFPVIYWNRLHDQNYLETKNIIEDFFMNSGTDNVEVLNFYHRFNDLFENTNYHRAQMIMHLKQHDLKIPNLQMLLIQ